MILRFTSIGVFFLLTALGCGEASTTSTPAPDAATEATSDEVTAEPAGEELQVSQPVEQPAAGGATFTHVIATQSPYYTTGPQQGRPPDGDFLVGTKVNLAQGEDGSDAPTIGSYTLVRSEDGVEAYVSTDALKAVADK